MLKIFICLVFARPALLQELINIFDLCKGCNDAIIGQVQGQ